MRFQGLVSKAIKHTDSAAVNPAQTIWRGVVFSQSGGKYQFVNEAGDPMFEEEQPVMGEVEATGWVLRQGQGDEQVPFYPILELIEVGTFPSSTAQNVGDAVRAMNGHALGFDIKCIDGFPLFAPMDADGNLIQLTDEQIGAFTTIPTEEGVAPTLVAPHGSLIHNNVLYTQVQHTVDIEDGETPTTTYAQFPNMRPLLTSVFNGVEQLISYDEAIDLIEDGSSVGVRTMSARVQYGRPRTQTRGVAGMDYISVVPGLGWPTVEVQRTGATGDYTGENTLWNAVRPLEATIIRQIRHCKALARQFPDLYKDFPAYCQPVDKGGYIQTASNAPSREAARRAAEAARQAGTGATGTGAVNLTNTVNTQIPDSTEDLLNA